MQPLPGKSASFWTETARAPSLPTYHGGLSVDVAVIGGGIVGLTAALLLKRAGRSVALIEARRVAQQVSGRTTAKVTSLHGLTYASLMENFGEAGARSYAEANQAAIERIADLIAELGIDCDFERKAAYTYSRGGATLKQVEEEARVAAKLGLPASFVREVPLPFPVTGAVRFDNQAQFHPCKYLYRLAAAIPGDGCHVFEQTRALDVEEADGSCRIVTDKGEMRARDVVVATNLPFLDRGGFFAKAYPKAHLVVAARIGASDAPDGMFLGSDQPGHSIRTAHDGDRTYLIALGPSFKTGHVSDLAAKYRELIEFAHRHFPVGEIAYRWMNEDYYSMDGLPYVGRLTPGSSHLYTATGFNAWGMTNGTVAAGVIVDMIQKRPTPWAWLFDATRVKPSLSASSFLKENLHVARHWLQDQVARPSKTAAALAPGEGALVEMAGRKVAAFRDAQGVLHAFSAKCPHMGCAVSWNEVEQTWDCGCHGSRFDAAGRLLHGPAVHDLERIQPAEEAIPSQAGPPAEG